MKKRILLISLIFMSYGITAQNYNPVINYSYNGTPTYGIKITTNIPFSVAGMPTIIIEGYEYADNPIGIILNWYVYKGNFHRAVASSFGNYTPEIKLYKEDNKIVIFINDKTYYDRFSIRAYSGKLGLNDSHFSNWQIEDKLPNGTNEKIVTYKNKFAGDITFPSGIWRNNGNLLIGKLTQLNNSYKLDVNGPIRANEIKVNTNGADFVFEKSYNLMPLSKLDKFIQEKKHLPEIKSALKMQKDGVYLGKLNTKLLQKIEELTLYTIQQEKKIEVLNENILKFQKRLEKLEGK